MHIFNNSSRLISKGKIDSIFANKIANKITNEIPSLQIKNKLSKKINRLILSRNYFIITS